MSSEWPIKRLGDCCEKIGSGATPKGGKDSYQNKGSIYLIRSQNIYNEGFKSSGLVFINEDQAKKLNNVSVKAGDVLLNITGDSVARVCQALKEFIPARVNQHVAIIRPNPTKLDARFLRYYLASPAQQGLMLSLASAGATRNALTKVMIEAFEIPCPSLEVQIQIAEVLGLLDSRITLFKETNKTLESISQAIFKSWFIDFDLVKNKTVKNDQKGVGDAINKIFPSTFIESSIGLIPEGWRVGLLGEEVKIAYGKNLPTTKLHSSGFPVYGGNGIIGFYNKYIYEARQLLVACRGAASGKINQSSPMAFVTNNSLVLESGDLSFLPFGYLKGYMLNSDLTPYVTGSAQPQVTIENLKSFKILVPDENVLREYENISKVIEDRIDLNNEQMQILSDIRNTLLPRLMSGQLKPQNVALESIEI